MLSKSVLSQLVKRGATTRTAFRAMSSLGSGNKDLSRAEQQSDYGI